MRPHRRPVANPFTSLALLAAAAVSAPWGLPVASAQQGQPQIGIAPVVLERPALHVRHRRAAPDSRGGGRATIGAPFQPRVSAQRRCAGDRARHAAAARPQCDRSAAGRRCRDPQPRSRAGRRPAADARVSWRRPAGDRAASEVRHQRAGLLHLQQGRRGGRQSRASGKARSRWRGDDSTARRSPTSRICSSATGMRGRVDRASRSDRTA